MFSGFCFVLSVFGCFNKSGFHINYVFRRVISELLIDLALHVPQQYTLFIYQNYYYGIKSIFKLIIEFKRSLVNFTSGSLSQYFRFYYIFITSAHSSNT